MIVNWGRPIQASPQLPNLKDTVINSNLIYDQKIQSWIMFLFFQLVIRFHCFIEYFIIPNAKKTGVSINNILGKHE